MRGQASLFGRETTKSLRMAFIYPLPKLRNVFPRGSLPLGGFVMQYSPFPISFSWVSALRLLGNHLAWHALFFADPDSFAFLRVVPSSRGTGRPLLFFVPREVPSSSTLFTKLFFFASSTSPVFFFPRRQGTGFTPRHSPFFPPHGAYYTLPFPETLLAAGPLLPLPDPA